MAAKFTRIPKVEHLIVSGVPTEVIPTYCCLADYSNNKSGLCWPKMETLARTLNRSVRTVQRHLHLLKEKGLIEFVERRRHKGRFRGSFNASESNTLEPRSRERTRKAASGLKKKTSYT